MSRSDKRSRLSIRIGQEFKAQRKLKGKTQQEFGEILFGEGGSSRAQMISDLENGYRNFTLAELEKLCCKVGLVVFINITSSSEIVSMSQGLQDYLKRIEDANNKKG